MINRLVYENLKHRWVRTALSAIVIGVQVTLLLTIVGLCQGMLRDSAQRIRGVGAEILLRPEGAMALTLSSASIPEKFVPFVAKQPHIKEVLGVAVAQMVALTSMAGVNYPQFEEIAGIRYLGGGGIQHPDDIVVDEYYQRQYKIRVGQTVTLLNHKWRVAGVIAEGKLSHVIASLPRLQELTGNGGRLTQIFVKIDTPANTQLVINQLNELLKGSLRAYSIEEFVSIYSFNNIPQLQTFINVVIGLSIVVGFLVVFLSMYTAVLERTREIGILKALGATPLTVLNILVRETIVLAITGSIVGIALALGARALIMGTIPYSIQVVNVPNWWPIAAAIAIVGALLGAIYPGLKAARQDTIEALAYE